MRVVMLSKSLVLLVGVAVAVSAPAGQAQAKKLLGAAFAGMKFQAAREKRKALELEREEAQAQRSGEPQSPAAAGGGGGETQSDEARTQKILADESRNSAKLHPLQTSEPNFNIVVCEAGCGDAKPRIVYRLPAASVRSASAETATPTSPVATSAECRGGCDGGPARRPSSVTGAAPGMLNSSAGEWLTATPPAAPAAPAPKAAIATAAPESSQAQPQGGKASRSDWMARINRERAAAKEQPSSASDAVSPSEVTVPESGPIKEGNPVN